MGNDYIEKSIVAKVDSVDTKTNTVIGYFSVFNVPDADGDVVLPGAFTKTLQEFTRTRHLWQHNPAQPLARPELTQDAVGLRFKSVISTTSYGKDVIQLYKDEVVDEHSFGGYVIRKNQNGSLRELQEVGLFEGSTVTFGANEKAIGGILKNMVETRDIAGIVERMDRVYKAIRNGRYENEETFDLLDIHHKQLKQILVKLTTEPAGATPSPGKTSEAAVSPALLEVRKNLQKAAMVNNLHSLTNVFNNVI